MDIIYRINMTDKSVKKEKRPESYRLLGGRALISKIMTDEVDPSCHPLGPNNKLILAPGLLAGTTAPSSGRLSVGAKSPLTFGIKESNAGGPISQSLAKMGIQAVIIEGRPLVEEEQFFVLRITPYGVEIIPAPEEIVGKGCYFTGKHCKEKYTYTQTGGVMTIGQAGEMRAAAACISITNMEGETSRQAGRGGMGAVMGSKKIKAIVVDNMNKNSITYDNPEVFRKTAYELGQQVMVAGAGTTANGTAGLVTPINNVGALPVKNFGSGNWDKAPHITGQQIHRLAEERGGRWGHSCHPGCCIRCSNIVVDKNGKYVTGSLEFETVALFGSNCLVDDLDSIARCDFKCDDYGVDTIDTAVACGVAMEAGIIGWGDKEGMENLLDEIGEKSIMGRVLASGANILGRVYGQWRVSQTKGQATAAYDPRGCKGTGVSYATSTMGGDHTVGNALPGRGVGDPKNIEQQAALSRNLQIYSAYLMDSTGFCLFVGPTHNKAAVGAALINARYGSKLNASDIARLGTEVLKREVSFNRAAGVPDVDFPEFERIEPLEPHGHVFDVPMEDIKKVHDFEYIFPEEKQAIF